MNYSWVLVALMLLTLQACGRDTVQTSVEATVSEDETQRASPPLPQVVSEERKLDVKRKAEQSLPAVSKSMMGMANRSYQQMDLGLLPYEADYRENYAAFSDNPVKRSIEQPLSTFSIDVDTGAYANVRRFLNQGALPDKHAVRVEEMINYFQYDYPRPHNTEVPFNLVTEIAPAPWNQAAYVLHLGIQGYEIEQKQLPAANLVFLVDVSGSMQSQDKLALLKSGLKLLVKQMDQEDRISLVVYAGASGVVLEPTAGDQQAKIMTALDALTAGGSTNGASGIRLAYQMAQQAFIPGGINRILLATDGDFNVGVTNFEALKQMVEQERKQGVALTTLGFGRGNYNDHLMEQLADVGNGNYSYIDNLSEARKVLVEQMGATLNTIAKDVKIQIEFNPAVVAEYRLIGYENRQLKREDFNNDKVDAGEIGAGHSVTALYEIILTGSEQQRVDALRYQSPSASTTVARADELAFVRLRYKQPNDENSQLTERVLQRGDIHKQLQDSSNNFRFSAAVAAFGQQLRGGQYMDDFNYDDILKLARDTKGQDRYGYRGEFLQLVSLAQSLN